ncbi:MAG: tape measure protein [Cyanobacteria bacterium P01_H01_bin.105]
MSTTIGSLIAELGIDASKYTANLKIYKQEGIKAARDVEKAFKNAVSLKDLKLVPHVDDQELTALNAHLSLKERHFNQVQQKFDRAPLRPKVDLAALNTLEDTLLNLDSRRTLDLKVAPQQNSSRSFDATTLPNDGLVVSNQELVSAIGNLTKAVHGSTKSNEELPVKISKSIYVSSKETLLDKIFNLPARVMESVVTGALEGVGQQVSFDFTKGALDYAEAKTGRSASTMGQDFGRFAYGRGKQALMVGADALGYRGGLQELAEDIGDFTDAVDKLLQPKLWVKKANEIENLVVASLEDVRVYNDPGRARERVGSYFSSEFEGLRTGVNRAAGVGVRAAATPFRVNKRVQLAQSMELSKILAEAMEVPDIEGIADKKAIALLTGGVDLSEGGTNTYFAKNIVEKALGSQVAAVPVPNAYSNSQDFGRGGDLKRLFADFLADVTGNEELRKQGEAIPLDRLLNISTEAGFNPDAILMDATRRAYEAKYGEDKRFIFAGTSAGTIAAEEATAIAERGGATNVKGFGATLPMAGLTNTASNENFRAFVGNLDPMAMAMFGEQFIDPDQLSRAQKKIVEASKLQGMPDLTGLLAPSRNTEIVQGTGEAHHLGQFLANSDVKKRLSQFLDLDLSTEYEGKTGTAAFKQYADMFGQFDALTRTLRMLEGDATAFAEEAAGKYSFVTPDLELRKTYGSEQEKADLEYAAEEYSTGKRVKGVAREDSEAFARIMPDLIQAVKGAGEEGPDLAAIDDLIKRMNQIFGEAPKFDQALYSDIQGLTRGRTEFQDISMGEKAVLEGQQAIPESIRKRRVRKPHSQYKPEELIPTPPAVDIPDIGGALAPVEEAQATGKELAQSFLKGVGDGLTNVAETAGTAMAESAEKGAVNLINRLMRRVPGDSQAIDVTAPTIDKLSDIGPKQIAKASALGVEDAANVLGQLAKAGASAAMALGKVSVAIGGSLKGAQPPANAFVGESRKQLGAAKDLLGNIQSAMVAGELGPESVRGLKMLSGTDDAQGYISRMLADVEAAIAQLPAQDRTKPLLGNQLANLKSQIAKIEKQLSEVVSQLDPTMLEAGSTPLALPSAERTIDLAQSPASQVRQLTAAQPPPNYKAQVKQLGLSFSSQLKSARSAEDPQQAAQMAQTIIRQADDARQAITELLENLGDDADEGLRNLASAARQRITKSVKGASKLTEGVDVGENVGTGLDSGLRSSIGDVQKSARDLAQSVIDEAEDTLDIQSPSKVFQRIGQYTVEGFRQGMAGFGDTLADLYKMADLYQTNLRKAFDSSVITSEIQLVLDDLSELGNALGRIANYPNEAIIQKYKKDVRSNAHLARSPQGMGMHPAGQNIPSNAQQVVFVSSGFTGTRGRISNEIAGKVGSMAPEGSHMVPFESKFDVSGTLDEVGIAKVIRDAILEPMKAVKQGYNSEAMRLAKQAYAVKQQRPDADIKMVGHSAGGFVVREAQEILKHLGVVSEALSMGTPLLGAFQAIKDDAVSLMGEFDQLRPFSGQREAVVPGVGGHFSPEYLDNSNQMQRLLTQYLEEGITPALIKKIHDLGEAIQGLKPGSSGGLMRFDRARSGNRNSLGGDVGAGFAQGLTGSTQLIATSAAELAEEAIEAAEDALEIASPSKVFIRIGEKISAGLAVGISKGKSALGPTLNSLKDRAVESFSNVVLGPESERNSQKQFQPFQVTGRRPEQDIPVIGEAFSFMLDSMESMKNAATFIPQLGRALSEVFEGLMQNTGLLMGMAKGAIAFNFVIRPLIGVLADFENQSFMVAVELDNMARMITFVSGSAREGARNIDFIREKVMALGGDINASMSGFGQLAASSQGTRMEGEGTRQLFGAISQASSVYQLDAQTQDRAFTATAQMLDKTVVSAEELRGQLAEALPGSLAVAARAMGMTTQEMGQMMSTGQIMAEDLLPKFAQQLSAETASGVAGSANSAQSAINQLNNEVIFLQEAVGKTSIPVRVTGIKAAATGMRLLRENMELVAPVMTAVFVTLMKNAVVNAIRFLAQFAPLTALFKTVTAQGAKMFAALLAGMKTFAAQFARTFILIQGVTDLLSIFQKALGDTSGGIRDLADISIAGWEDYADSVKKAAEAQEQLNASADKFRTPSRGDRPTGNTITSLTGGESLLEQTFLGSILPKEAVRGFERATQIGGGFRTFEDVKAEQQTLAIGDLLAAGGRNTSEAMRLLGGGSYATANGMGSFKQVTELDQQLRDLQQQRSAIAPGDADTRRKLEQEINDLIKQRESLYAPIGKLQRNLTQDVENYKDALKVVEEELARAGLSDSRRSQLEGQAALLEAELGMAQKQLDEINATIGQSVNRITLLGRELRGIAATLASSRLGDQLMAGQQNLALAQARVNGASSGEVGYTSNILRREQLQTQISTNQTAITGFENTLADSEYVRALENAGLSAEATSADIQAAIDNLAEGSLRTTLETVGEFRGQLETLQIDTLGLQEQVAQAQAEAQQQVRDANREITAYYREVSQQSKELAMQVKETAASNQFNEIKGALKKAMAGLSGTFFDDWIGGFMSFLETVQGIIQTRIDADRQRAELEQQQMQARMQAQQIGRNLPGMAPGMNAGGFVAPLAGQTVQSLVDYVPSKELGQHFHAKRDGGARIHRGVDIDSRAGGGLGAQVMASMGGTARVYDIGEQEGDVANSVGIAIASQLGNGIPIEIRYNHLNLNDVQRDLGIGIGGTAQVNAGQALGTVVNHHLDYKVLVNGEHVDPQEFMAAMASGGGVASTVDGRSIQIVANAPATQASPVVPAATTSAGLTVKGKAATQEQIGIAQRIYQVGSSLGANNQEIQAAIATAIQESVLTNLSRGDRDSLGIFQQRPSMEWGSRSQIADLDFAIESFFMGRGSNRGMIENRSRAGGDVYQQSHLTQASAHPDAPRQWDGEAAALLQAVSRTGQSVAGVNMGQFGQTQVQQTQNFDLQRQLIDKNAQSQIRLQEIEASLQAQGVVAQTNRQRRDVEDQTLEMTRRRQDRTLAVLPQGDVRSRAEESISGLRSFRDQNEGDSRLLQDINNQLSRSGELLEAAQIARQAMVQDVASGAVDSSLLDDLDSQIEALEQFIVSVGGYRDEISALSGDAVDFAFTQELTRLDNQLQDLNAAGGNLDPIEAATLEASRVVEGLEENLDGLIEVYRASALESGMTAEQVGILVDRFEAASNVDLSNARRELRLVREEAELAQESALLQFRAEGLGELTRVLNRSGQGGQAQELNYQNQLRQIDADERQRKLEIERDTQLGPSEREQALKEAESMFGYRRENAAFDNEMAIQNNEFGIRQRSLDARQGLLGARQSQADMLGFGGIAPLRQEEMNLQLDMQQLDFEQQLTGLYEFADATGMSTEKMAELRTAIEQTNQLSVDNIKTQFSDLPEIIGAIKQPMTDALQGWISGTQSFGEAFDNMLSSILSNLISVVANKAVSGLLGSLLGSTGGSGAGQTGGIPGLDGGFGGGGLLGIAGSLFGGLFSQGGRVAYDGKISNFMSGGPLRGGNPIREAMKREGTGARLIVANDTEWILNRKHQEILKAYGVDEEVLNFKAGGPVGGRSFGSAARNTSKGSGSSGGISINIPVTVNGGNEDDGRELAKRLADPVKALIASEISRMRKPGGQLRSRN